MKAPNKRTVRGAIRGSVPGGKLRQAQIKLAKVEQNKLPIGGYTQYAPKGGAVIEIGAPVMDDAFGVAVRGHETRHATRHKPARKKPMTANEAIASQIVDDVNVETSPLPRGLRGLRAYKRAHCAVAMRDMRVVAQKARAVKAGKAPDSIETRNANLLSVLRSSAMLGHYDTEGGKSDWQGRAVASKAIGDKMLEALHKVIALAKSRRHRARAISMLCALMEEPEPDDRDGEEGERDGEEPTLHRPEEGSALEGHMQIVDLRPKSVFCCREKSITRRYAPNGVIINATRYVNAILNGVSDGLFARRVRLKPGGTVLIDASGSMGVTAERLLQLCETIPTATVAYYCGHDGTGKGKLCVYALKGKRFADQLPVSTMMGGNAVDLPAVRWMFNQPRPWTLVSDLAFCGGTLGSEEIAHALVERATRRGELTVIRSLDAAYETFSGSKQMK
jgi:hypothetical protein